MAQIVIKIHDINGGVQIGTNLKIDKKEDYTDAEYAAIWMLQKLAEHASGDPDITTVEQKGHLLGTDFNFI